MASSIQHGDAIRRAHGSAGRRTDSGRPSPGESNLDRLFKTGYIDTNGAVRNVLPGEQPVFQIRQANTLQTFPSRWGNIRDRWATTYDAAAIKTTRIREGMSAQFRFEAFNALNTPVFFVRPEPVANFGQFREAYSR